MNVKPVDRIISAKDYGGSATAYIRNWQREKHRQGIAVPLKDLDKRPATGTPLQAIIWQGQWIVRTDCCNSASFVDPDDPIVFCFTCANRSNGFAPRPVIFPPTLERMEIERLLLERPVDDVAGLTDMERAGLARPLLYVEVDEPVVEPDAFMMARGEAPQVRMVKRTYPLVRSWEGEPLEKLHEEQDVVIRSWKRKLKET